MQGVAVTLLTRDSAPIYSLYFISWIVMGAFFVINMVVGCVIDNFEECKHSESGALLMTKEQGEWVEATRVVSHRRIFLSFLLCLLSPP